MKRRWFVDPGVRAEEVIELVGPFESEAAALEHAQARAFKAHLQAFYVVAVEWMPYAVGVRVFFDLTEITEDPL